MSLRRFLRLLWRNPEAGTAPKAPDSLARTAKDAMHMRGSNQQAGGFSGSSAVYDQIAKGHENYAKSFKKKDER